MTLDSLGERIFAGVPEVAEVLSADERTIRRAIAAGEIPATRVGTRHMIPVSWLREQAGTSAPTVVAPDLDQLADRVAELIFARFARMFGGGGPPGEAA